MYSATITYNFNTFTFFSEPVGPNISSLLSPEVIIKEENECISSTVTSPNCITYDHQGDEGIFVEDFQILAADALSAYCENIKVRVFNRRY